MKRFVSFISDAAVCRVLGNLLIFLCFAPRKTLKVLGLAILGLNVLFFAVHEFLVQLGGNFVLVGHHSSPLIDIAFFVPRVGALAGRFLVLSQDGRELMAFFFHVGWVLDTISPDFQEVQLKRM